ncbi:MAG: hypothetical protein HKP06_08575 [Flavobacteriaceae bacterium]|nr:hypothetical protein [Flavobacteriaceae bacterium]
MKKNIIIFGVGILILGIAAFGIFDQNVSNTDQAMKSSTDVVAEEQPIADNSSESKEVFVHKVGPRFNSITKSELIKATDFRFFIGDAHADKIVSYSRLDVILLEDSEQTNIREKGTGGDLTPDQIKFLKSVDYSTNLLVYADYVEKNKTTGEMYETHWTPYLTVVPEKQATYLDFSESFIDYLKVNLKPATTMLPDDQIKPGLLYFTVSKNGTISNTRIQNSSGFESLDEKLIELIEKAPGNWVPAKNSKGEQVDQELTVSFGKMGC